MWIVSHLEKPFLTYAHYWRTWWKTRKGIKKIKNWGEHLNLNSVHLDIRKSKQKIIQRKSSSDVSNQIQEDLAESKTKVHDSVKIIIGEMKVEHKKTISEWQHSCQKSLQTKLRLNSNRNFKKNDGLHLNCEILRKNQCTQCKDIREMSNKLLNWRWNSQTKHNNILKSVLLNFESRRKLTS